MNKQPDTLPKHFLMKVQKYGADKVAMRQKDMGIWKSYSWQDSYQQVRRFCAGLVELGVERDHKVAIVGDNDPQYYWALLAIQAIGAVAVGGFTDARPEELKYVVGFADCTLVLAKDQEQCDKFLEIKAELSGVSKVVYWDDKGLWNYNTPWLTSFEQVQTLGDERLKENPTLFEDLVAQGSSNDLAIFCYTSGTTGLPKAAMLSHGNLLFAQRAYSELEDHRDADNYVSFLPLAWISEHVLGVASHVADGLIINFVEAPETVQNDIREIAPENLFYAARIWEGLVGQVQARINDSTPLNRWLYHKFLPVGYKMGDLKFSGQRIPLSLKIKYAIGQQAIFAPLRDKLGLTRVRSAYTAGGALSPDVMRFFRALGINLKQIYGSTETTGGATAHRDTDIKFESVGQPLNGVSLRIADDGEIQVKGDGIFKGYYKNPDATAEVVDGKGWFSTGDAGYIDEDQHLICLGRMKELIELSGGEKYPPHFIEGSLKFSPYLREVMTIGGAERPYVAALIAIDFDNVGRWAEKQGIAYTTYVDLSQKPEVYQLIRQDVERVNNTLPPPARIKRFVNMHKEFDADENELTRTRKLRRGYLEEKYRQMIEAIYAGNERVTMRAAVKYQDGREGIIETPVTIMTLEELL